MTAEWWRYDHWSYCHSHGPHAEYPAMNSQTVPQLQIPSTSPQGSKNRLMINRVCHPACFQLSIGGFSTKFHLSQENTWTAPQKVHTCLPKVRHTPKDPSFPTELQGGSKTKTVHQQGFISQTNNYRAEIANPAPSPGAKWCLQKTSWTAAVMLTLYQEEHRGALL